MFVSFCAVSLSVLFFFLRFVDRQRNPGDPILAPWAFKEAGKDSEGRRFRGDSRRTRRGGEGKRNERKKGDCHWTRCRLEEREGNNIQCAGVGGKVGWWDVEGIRCCFLQFLRCEAGVGFAPAIDTHKAR